MSFSSLPTELVRQIIESSVPYTFHSTMYKDRQSKLRSLCLVCHRFQSIAQRLLFEIIWIKSGKQVDLVSSLASGEDRYSNNRCLVVDRCFDESIDGESFHQLIGCGASFEKLVLAGTGRNLDAFPSMPLTHLTDLHLSKDCPSLAIVFSITALRSLTLYHVSLDTMQALLKPAVVPSLQAFALVDANDEYAEWLLQTDILALLPQLDALSIDMNVWTSLDATFRQRIATKTLVDCSSESMPAALTQPEQALNIRIYTSPIDSMSTASLNEITADVASSAEILEEAESSIPASLYLDHSLQFYHNFPSTLESAIEVFIKVCEQKRVEIVWEESPVQDFDVDPVISSEFWRRQRERKRLERDQAK